MKHRNRRRVVALAAAAVLVVSSTTLVVAQRLSADERNAIFASVPRVQTGVKGVTALAAPPEGFNYLAATNRELLSYGLPQRPDPAADAKAFEHWQAGMSALQACSQHAQTAGPSAATPGKSCHPTQVIAKSASSHTRMLNAPSTVNSDGTKSSYSSNWSGIVQSNGLKAWNAKKSFVEVESVFNVPVANFPFGDPSCSWGPWWEVSWNGIDGTGPGSLVQAGSSSYWDGGGCGGPIEYYGWFEWVPSYPILAINANVSPGDDFWVITFAAEGTVEQYAFVEDITQQWSGTFGMTWKSGPGVVGATAEYIVERPCCLANGNLYPLGNYVYDWFDYSFSVNGAGKYFAPGAQVATTDYTTMQADEAAGFQSISFADAGSTGYQGLYSIWFQDEGCAQSVGCEP